MKTFNVISADIITKAGIEPFVGLTVNVNGKQEQIARTCKQALLDLHKSARGSNIPAGLLDNGVASANPILFNAFRNAIIGLINKTGIADVTFYEAGEEYEAIAESSAVKIGKAQVGDILKTDKKGSRVEGFIAFPLTDLENAQQTFLATANPMAIMQGLFGISMPNTVQAIVEPASTPAVPAEPVVPVAPFGEEPEGDFVDPETVNETLKEKAPKGAKVEATN